MRLNNFIVMRDNIVAFGQDYKDANYMWDVKYFQKNPDKIVSSKYSIDQYIKSAWAPANNLLHISGVGCLKYDSSCIIETKSGTKVPVTSRVTSIYEYMSKLFGNSLTFMDISVFLKDYLNVFFKNISNEFSLIEEYPEIVCINEDNGFNPGTVYKFDGGATVGLSDKYIGLKPRGAKFYYAVESEFPTNQYYLIYYLAYRAGLVFDKKGEFVNVTTSEEVE